MKLLRAGAAVPVGVILFAGGAWAAFGSSGSGSGAARSERMPEGARPSVQVSGRSVQVRWEPAAFSDGTRADSYTVRRYDLDGLEHAVGSGCAGEQEGLECTESQAPPGAWRYTVTARYRGWTGSESEPSAVATVAGAALRLVSALVTRLPATLEGVIDSFPDHELLEFRLDAIDGPSLSGSVDGLPTPAPVPSGGGGAITVTLPAGIPEGDHRVFAIASPGGESATASVLIDTVTPTLESLEMRDADADGWVDRVSAAFTENLAPYSAGTSPWTLANAPSGAVLTAVSVEGSVAELLLAEGTGPADTSVGTFTVSLDPAPEGVRDVAGNRSSFPATAPADRAGPAVVSLATRSVPGGTEGKMETGDLLKLGFSEDLVEAFPLLSTALLADPQGARNDTLEIVGVTAGPVDTGSDGYVLGDGAEATFPSVLLEIGLTQNVLRIAVLAPCDPPLGESACSAILDAGGPGVLAFRPSASLRDAAGNPAAGTFSTGPEFRLF